MTGNVGPKWIGGYDPQGKLVNTNEARDIAATITKNAQHVNPMIRPAIYDAARMIRILCEELEEMRAAK